MNRPPSLCVVILNWNSADHTVGAVQSLPTEWRDGIIVVDNGSADQPAELAALRPLGTRVIAHRPNGGFAVGMNVGLRAARAAGFSHAVMVNSDSRPTAEALLAMWALTPDHALVGVAQRAGLDQSTSADRYVTAAVGSSLTPRELHCPGCDVGHHRVDVVSGAVMLVDLTVLESLGWIDPRFFHYKEEFDLAYRMGTCGHPVAWVCSQEVAHAVGATIAQHSPDSCYYKARNEILFFRKHGGLRRPDLLLRLSRVELTFLSRYRNFRHWLSGVRDGIAGVSGPRRQTP